MLGRLPVVLQLLVRLVFRQTDLTSEYLGRVSGACLVLFARILIGTILVSRLLCLLNSLATFSCLYLILIYITGRTLILVSGLLLIR